MTHACNPSYSGGRDQEDQGLKVRSQLLQNSCETLSQKKENPLQKRASGVAQGVGPEFKPQYWKKNCAKISKTKFSIDGTFK
jgi:hypothetical protein